MDKGQKFNLTRQLSKTEDNLTPQEYRGVDEVIQLIAKEEYLSKVLEGSEDRLKDWKGYYEEFRESHVNEVVSGITIAIAIIEESMPVDLRKCEEGDQLLSCHGTTLYYVRPCAKGTRDYLDHVVRYPNGSEGTRTVDGYTFAHNRLKTDENIVKLIKV